MRVDRYPAAFSPVLKNVRRAFFSDPTDCPWLSKDEIELASDQSKHMSLKGTIFSFVTIV